MIFKAFIFTLLLCSLIHRPVFSQGKKIDSLLLVLKYAKEDTAKVHRLIELFREFRYSNVDTALYLCNEALALATRLNYEMGIADSKRGLCALHASLGKFDEGVKYGEEALIFYNKLLSSATASDKEKILAKIGSAYMVIGHNRGSQGNYPEAMKYDLLCLKIKEQLGDKKGIADIKANIGSTYVTQHNYSEALKYFYAALKISEELGNNSDIAVYYNAIGWIHIEQRNYPEALKNCSVALKLAEEAKNDYALAQIYDNLGVINEKQGNFNEALKYYFAALVLYDKIGIDEAIPAVHNDIATVYMKLKKYNEASEYLSKALSLVKKSRSLEYTKLTYQNWARLDSTRGNFIQAFEHYKLFAQYRDSLINNENTKKIVQLQMQYDFDKKEDSLNQKHIITATKLQVQRKQKYFYWAGLFMLGLLSVFVFLNFRNQKKLNKLASETHARQKAEMELQAQQALLSERLRISSELHDEVGATLSGIAMYSHLTREQMKTGQTAEIEKSLNIMQQSSTQMVDKLSDIVWLINPEQDSLQKLVTRLEEYATDMAAIKNMHVKIDVPEKISEINLPVESRRNIYLFCKEAINNAVKYSNATLLELTVKEVNGKLEFSVSDNGKGFDAVMVRRGNGLENMQKRADEIGAKLLLQSKENGGASVSLQCKIT
jgi:two-component system sensor histidine kinase UhpB